MTKAQGNFFNMGKSVYDVFCTCDIWRDVALIDDSVETIGNLIGLINEEAVKQQKNETSGYTATKDKERTLLEDKVMRMAQRLNVYALKNDDNVLLAQVNLSRSALGNMSLNNLLTTARAITETAAELVESIDPRYHVTDADIDDLQDSIATTEEVNTRRDSVRSGHTENTSHLAKLFKTLRNELKLMDTQVRAFITDEVFLHTYFNARKIYDVRGGGKRKVEIEM